MASEARLRVAFDATSLLGPRTGVGHVTAGMLEALAADPTLDLTAFSVTWRGRRDLPPALPVGVRAAARPFPARLARELWPRVGRPRAEYWTGPVDVVHAPNFVAPPSRAPVLVTVHDLTFARFPEMCTADTLTFPDHLRRALDAGATIHTYSDFVAREVRDCFDLPTDRVVRIYPGLSPTAGGDAARGRAIAGSARYVLALGTVEPRKNLPRLVQAFDAVAGNRSELVLVVAGPDGWGVAAFDAACAAARHADRIRRIGYVTEPERRDLLAGATVLAYPSLYEGFGHPPLEAMQAGVPVVASNAGALPEVLGDAALLPDPLDADAIADALSILAGDATRRDTVIALGHARATRYSWDAAADRLTLVYKRLAVA